MWNEDEIKFSRTTIYLKREKGWKRIKGYDISHTFKRKHGLNGKEKKLKESGTLSPSTSHRPSTVLAVTYKSKLSLTKVYISQFPSLIEYLNLN